MDEKALIEKLRSGDRDAFRGLVDSYQDRVYNTVYGIVQNRNDAEELTQDTFVTVFRTIAKFRSDSSLTTWIYRIAVNKALNHVRAGSSFSLWGSRKKQVADPELQLKQVHDVSAKPDEQLQHRELAAQLQKAIAALPDRQRTAFVLHKLEDLSHRDIAAILETSESSVESLIHRAKENLQKSLVRLWKGLGV